MRDGRPLLGRDPVGQERVHLVDPAVEERDAGLGLLRLRLLELPVPPLELTLDVAVSAPEVTQPDCVDVDGVDLDEHVDEVLPDRPPLAFVEHRVRRRGRAQDLAVDEVHHVEARAVHGFVTAEPQGRGHRDRRVEECRDDRVLSAHVVRTGEDVAHGWASQYQPPAPRVGDLEREVRPPSRDELEVEGCRHSLDVGNEPLRDARRVDTVGHRCASQPRIAM